MEVYRSETKEIVRRFVEREIDFPECIAALDAALSGLLAKPSNEQVQAVREILLANNDAVMEEMGRHGLREIVTEVKGSRCSLSGRVCKRWIDPAD